jgi:hypothetical protein
MKKRLIALPLVLLSLSAAQAADVVRHSNNSNFPIARAVEVPEEFTMIHHSGLTPAPANPQAKEGSPEYWGDTKTQAAETARAFHGAGGRSRAGRNAGRDRSRAREAGG